jgi:hypothetical protein
VTTSTIAANSEPDWERFQSLSAEIRELETAGTWDKDAFERILKEGEKAAKGHGELLEFIVNHADPDWL